MDNQLNNVVNEENDLNNNIPFVQKLVFFLVGFSMNLLSLAIWFLFKDEKKYVYKLRYIKNGAIAGLLTILFSFILGFLVGFCGVLISL